MAVRDLTENPNILDLDLPEIQDRDPYTPPTSRLEKTGPETWEEKSGRRTSNALLVNKLRDEVDAWRAAGSRGWANPATGPPLAARAKIALRARPWKSMTRS